jgi:hypothetical protein
MGFAGYVTVCVQLYCVSCHCLTLHGYLQVCSIFLLTNNKRKASRQTHTQETTKLTKENNAAKNKWKNAYCYHVRKAKKKKKTPSEADSFRHMEIKISYTLEDGHVGRNM